VLEEHKRRQAGRRGCAVAGGAGGARARADPL